MGPSRSYAPYQNRYGREFGGRDRVRTCDLVVANDALSQLSYTPTSCNKILADALDLAN